MQTGRRDCALGIRAAGSSGSLFERFLRDEALPALRLPGTTISVLKGDRGERSGHYLLLMQFESVETRDHLFPGPDTASAQRCVIAGNCAASWVSRTSTLVSAPNTGGGVSQTKSCLWRSAVTIAAAPVLELEAQPDEVDHHGLDALQEVC